MKKHPQRFCDLENKEKESKGQILTIHTEESSLLFKKWLTFSWKDYVIIFLISLTLIVFKVYVYVTFVQEMNYVQKMGHNLNNVDTGKLEEFTFLFLLLVLISACVLLTVPVILMLRAILTSQLKKKIQRLEELTRKHDNVVYK
ncbi:hypothetical protein [Bartonella gliris]|uniref:hypothetical protein n=1 Tax=Bartonella gliris TaxID=3004109 RepID=UPI00295E92A1|nr:hypothetical protein [Bartonella gliris]